MKKSDWKGRRISLTNFKTLVHFGTWKNKDSHGKPQNTRSHDKGSNWCPPEYEFLNNTLQN